MEAEFKFGQDDFDWAEGFFDKMSESLKGARLAGGCDCHEGEITIRIHFVLNGRAFLALHAKGAEDDKLLACHRAAAENLEKAAAKTGDSIEIPDTEDVERLAAFWKAMNAALDDDPELQAAFNDAAAQGDEGELYVHAEFTEDVDPDEYDIDLDEDDEGRAPIGVEVDAWLDIADDGDEPDGACILCDADGYVPVDDAVHDAMGFFRGHSTAMPDGCENVRDLPEYLKWMGIEAESDSAPKKSAAPKA